MRRHVGPHQEGGGNSTGQQLWLILLLLLSVTAMGGCHQHVAGVRISQRRGFIVTASQESSKRAAGAVAALDSGRSLELPRRYQLKLQYRDTRRRGASSSGQRLETLTVEGPVELRLTRRGTLRVDGSTIRIPQAATRVVDAEIFRDNHLRVGLALGVSLGVVAVLVAVSFLAAELSGSWLFR